MTTAIDELRRARYLSLASYRRDGTPVATPVWFAEDSGALYVFTNEEAGKVKRLRRDARVRVARCTVGGRLLGPWFDSEARLVEDHREIERAFGALRARYGLSMRIADLFSTLAGRIGARRIIRVELPGTVVDGPVAP